MNKIASIIITITLLVGLGVVFLAGSKSNSDGAIDSTQATQNVEIKEGVQYVTIDAKAGYFPKVSRAKAGIPTKLVVRTNGTYDCSLSLVIRSVGYQKILSQTGEEVIDIGIPKAGEPLQGVCGMGMYSFLIHFT